MADLDTKFDWGWVIFLILILWFFVGGNGFFGNGFGRGYGYGNGFLTGDIVGSLGNCHGTSNCEMERRSIINSAETRYLIEQKAAETNAIVNAQANITNTKIDFYQYEAQKEKVADLKMENIYLKNQLADTERFNALNARLDSIECNMAKAPKAYPYSYLCPAAPQNCCGNFQTV